MAFVIYLLVENFHWEHGKVLESIKNIIIGDECYTIGIKEILELN